MSSTEGLARIRPPPNCPLSEHYPAEGKNVLGLRYQPCGTGGKCGREIPLTTESLAPDNEVSIFNPGYFNSRQHTVSYTYILFIPLSKIILQTIT